MSNQQSYVLACKNNARIHFSSFADKSVVDEAVSWLKSKGAKDINIKRVQAWCPWKTWSAPRFEVEFKHSSIEFCESLSAKRPVPVIYGGDGASWSAQNYPLIAKARYDLETAILQGFADKRLLSVTLTQKNVPYTHTDLTKEIHKMEAAFGKLVSDPKFPGLGWVRSLEATRRGANAHPHYHCLLLVDEQYFKKESGLYLTHEDWASMWATSMQLEYKPVVSVMVADSVKGVGSNKSAIARRILAEVVKTRNSTDNIKLSRKNHRVTAIGGQLAEYLERTEY